MHPPRRFIQRDNIQPSMGVKQLYAMFIVRGTLRTFSTSTPIA